jgi:hypothetical protein
MFAGASRMQDEHAGMQSMRVEELTMAARSKKREWKQVSKRVWVSGDFAIEEDTTFKTSFFTVFHQGEWVGDFDTLPQAQRAATPALVEKAARQRAAWVGRERQRIVGAIHQSSPVSRFAEFKTKTRTDSDGPGIPGLARDSLETGRR